MAATDERAAAAARRERLVDLYRELRDCRKCPLAEGRTTVVFGTGNADADLMFVGEAPGFHEDQQGKPFVGRAGKLLDQLLAPCGGRPFCVSGSHRRPRNIHLRRPPARSRTPRRAHRRPEPTGPRTPT